MANGEITVLVLFDLTKAFDCVNHDVLISKLKHINFSESALRWIKSNLYHRKQRVIRDNDKSEWCDVNCGVPQGSVLGPLLYSL
jgi:hypothetical protein